MIAGIVLAYSYFELNSPRALCVVMVPVTLALAGLMISHVPYPSFKGLDMSERAQIQLMAVVLMVAAMLLAMPQFTLFVLASAYVLSGPYLMACGERIGGQPPMLKPSRDEHAHAAAEPPEPERA
jgi:CDP-diacylglycerol---serine O-phosphatidyltransferase